MPTCFFTLSYYSKHMPGSTSTLFLGFAAQFDYLKKSFVRKVYFSVGKLKKIWLFSNGSNVFSNKQFSIKVITFCIHEIWCTRNNHPILTITLHFSFYRLPSDTYICTHIKMSKKKFIMTHAWVDRSFYWSILSICTENNGSC